MPPIKISWKWINIKYETEMLHYLPWKRGSSLMMFPFEYSSLSYNLLDIGQHADIYHHRQPCHSRHLRLNMKIN